MAQNKNLSDFSLHACGICFDQISYRAQIWSFFRISNNMANFLYCTISLLDRNVTTAWWHWRDWKATSCCYAIDWACHTMRSYLKAVHPTTNWESWSRMSSSLKQRRYNWSKLGTFFQKVNIYGSEHNI